MGKGCAQGINFFNFLFMPQEGALSVIKAINTLFELL